MCDLHFRDGAVATAPRTITDLVDELIVAVTNGRIYSPTHPRVRTTLDSLEACLEALCAARGVPVIQLGAADGCLFFERKPLLDSSLAAPKLLDPLRKLQAGGIAFERGAQAIDFAGLVEALGRGLKQLESARRGQPLAGQGELHAHPVPAALRARRVLAPPRRRRQRHPRSAGSRPRAAAAPGAERPGAPLPDDRQHAAGHDDQGRARRPARLRRGPRLRRARRAAARRRAPRAAAALALRALRRLHLRPFDPRRPARDPLRQDAHERPGVPLPHRRRRR